MLKDQMRIPTLAQELIIDRLRKAGLMGTSPATQFLHFTVALVDAACCRPNNSTEIVECSGTITHMAQRLRSVAPFTTLHGHPATMMMPDIGDTIQGGGPLDPDKLLKQWDPLLTHLNSKWEGGSAHRIPRGDFYRWLAGDDVGIHKIDLVIRCGNERADYGNLVLVFDLARSSLRTLPEELWKGLPPAEHKHEVVTRIEALQRLGHMNSVVVLSQNSGFKHLVPKHVPTFALGSRSTFASALNLVRALHVPDRHVQPDYRGVTCACAFHGNVNGLETGLVDTWDGITPEVIDEQKLAVEIQGFWNGVVLLVDEKIEGKGLVLTTGVTREPVVDWL